MTQALPQAAVSYVRPPPPRTRKHMEQIVQRYWTDETMRPLATSVLERSIRELRRALALLNGDHGPAQQECGRAFRYALTVMERELARRTELSTSAPTPALGSAPSLA